MQKITGETGLVTPTPGKWGVKSSHNNYLLKYLSNYLLFGQSNKTTH